MPPVPLVQVNPAALSDHEHLDEDLDGQADAVNKPPTAEVRFTGDQNNVCLSWLSVCLSICLFDGCGNDVQCTQHD